MHQNLLSVAWPTRSSFKLSLFTDHCKFAWRQRHFLYNQFDASSNACNTRLGLILSNYFLQSSSVSDRARFWATK